MGNTPRDGRDGLPGRDSSGNGNSYPTDMPTWLKIVFLSLQKFGIATIILLFGGYWVATRVAEPMVATYQEFIRVQSKVSQEQSDTLKAMKDSEVQRLTTIKDNQILLKAFQETTSKQHDAMLASQSQMLDDHRQFMERLKKP